MGGTGDVEGGEEFANLGSGEEEFLFGKIVEHHHSSLVFFFFLFLFLFLFVFWFFLFVCFFEIKKEN